MRPWIWMLSLLVCLLLQRAYARFRAPELQITFFDVGQGDASLIQFPGGKTLLVDAGGGFGDWNLGERELFPELARLSILRLDYALLSHPDQDHGFGFRGIFERMEVGELWMHAAEPEEGPQRRLTDALRLAVLTAGSRLRRFDRDQSFQIGNAGLRLMPLGGRGASSNNRSLVLALEYAGCRALFTGDMEKAQEQALLSRWREPVTLLKVAHHGSKTSSTDPWLEHLTPRWAVISVGLPNGYGHPHVQVLRRLRAHQVQTFRTDFHGFVQFTISRQGEVHCRTAQGDCGVGQCGPYLIKKLE